MNTIDLIKARLLEVDPEAITVDIRDDSALHAGHEGAKGGGGHYHLAMVSPRFRSLSLPARHRLVYDALRPMMQTAIHALSIKANAPEEV